MVDTVFVDKQTLVPAAWLNDVNRLTYKQTAGLSGNVPRSAESKLSNSVYVTDFGTKGNGTTDDDAPLFNAAIASGAKYIIVPWTTTNYLLLTPINHTTDAGSDRACGITWDFQTSTDLNPAPFGTCQILVKHTGHAFDMSGSRDCTFNNLCAYGDATTKPKTLIFSARNSAASDCGRHRFNNVRSVGFWTVCPLYMYGTEESEFDGLHLQNAEPGKSVVTITTNNIASLSSTFITIATGAQSTTVNNFWGGSYWQIGNSGMVNETCFYLDGVGDINIDGPHLFCQYGLAYVYISGVNQASIHIRIKNLRGEVSGSNQPLHGIYLGPASAPMTHQALCVNDCRLPCGTGAGTGFMVYADANINIASSNISGLYNSIGNGISFLGMVNTFVALQQNLVQGRATGIVSGNQFFGEDSNIQLSGTNSNNLIYGEDSFTPTITCAVPGDLNVVYSSRIGNISRVGRLVTITIALITSTFTHSTASGQFTISGIPAGFASAAGAVIGAVGAFGGFTSAGFTQLGAQASGGTSIFLVKSGSAQPLTNCAITDFPTGSTVTLYVTLTYFI